MKQIIFALVFLCSITASAQHKYPEQKLSRYLKGLTQDLPEARRNSDEGRNNHVCVLMKLEPGYDVNAIAHDYNIEVFDNIGKIYIVNIPVNLLGEVSCDSRVMRIEAHEAPRPIMNKVPTSIGADRAWKGEELPQAFTGKGVIAGVIDSDLDFTHPMFLDSLGNTRVKRFIDVTTDSLGNVKNDVYDSEELMELRHCPMDDDRSYHGTHVTSIMAGSVVSSETSHYSGIAPEADLVFECQESSQTIQLGDKGSTTASFLLAFKHIFDYADECNQSCVINASWGANFSPMDPCILENEALKELTGPGRIIVAGAGNHGNVLTVMEKAEDIHETNARFESTNSPLVLFLMTDHPQTIKLEAFPDLELDIPTDTLDMLRGNVCDINSDSLIFVEGFKVMGVSTHNYQNLYGIIVYIDNYINEYESSLMWYYSNRVSLVSDYPGLLYAYPYVCNYRNDGQSYLNSHYTLLWPAESEDVIAVGSYNDRQGSYGNIGMRSTFSSEGPTWDGRIKPDVLAPGINIFAAGNSFYRYASWLAKDSVFSSDNTRYDIINDSGTSMASPVVAGAVALWLQAKPDLSPTDIQNLLARTCKHPIDNLSYPNIEYGYGTIDVYAGLLDILGIDGIKGITHHQPRNLRFILKDKVLSVIDRTIEAPVKDKVKITVYSTNGIIVSSSVSNSIDLSRLPSGVYAVQVDSSRKEETGSTLIRL